MSAQANPYAPPSARVDDVVNAGPGEEIRREHIQHEASIRSMGMLYLLGGGLSLVASVFGLAGSFAGEQTALITVLMTVYLALGILLIVTGRGVRRLQPWARTIAIVLSCIGLLGIPLGTLINGYFLYLLLSAKGKRIFEPDYSGIVAATPHIKYRTSTVAWIVLAILVLGVAAAIVVPMLGR
jgi:hypothetical protein